MAILRREFATKIVDVIVERMDEGDNADAAWDLALSDLMRAHPGTRTEALVEILDAAVEILNDQEIPRARRYDAAREAVTRLIEEKERRSDERSQDWTGRQARTDVLE